MQHRADGNNLHQRRQSKTSSPDSESEHRRLRTGSPDSEMMTYPAESLGLNRGRTARPVMTPMEYARSRQIEAEAAP